MRKLLALKLFLIFEKLFELFDFSVTKDAKTSPWRPWRLGGSITRNQPPRRQGRQEQSEETTNQTEIPLAIPSVKAATFKNFRVCSCISLLKKFSIEVLSIIQVETCTNQSNLLIEHLLREMFFI